MIISVITLFPEVFEPLINSSIIAKARKEGHLEVRLVNLREFGVGSHKQVDDQPYGGGVGMLLRVDVLAKAIKKAKRTSPRLVGLGPKRRSKAKVVLLTPQGKVFSQKMARNLAGEKHLILICGHYEGVDERTRALVDEELSIGDYVLSGGEVPAMAVLDAITRLVPGVLDKEATEKESLSEWKTKSGRREVLLEPPQYTRPEVLLVGRKKFAVPEVLLSGNHKEIEEWRMQKALEKTKKVRPELLKGYSAVTTSDSEE